MNLIIQTAIAVIVVYLVFSVIVYICVEWFSSIFKIRQYTLKDALSFALSPQVATLIYKHPQIERLSKKGLPSYIPANNFALALIDETITQAGIPRTPADAPTQIFQNFQAAVPKLPTSELQKLLVSLLGTSTSLEQLTISIEEWFNRYMDRVTGWYKRKIKVFVFGIAAIVTVACNVDSIHVIRTAATDSSTRDRLNAFADQILKDSLINTVVMQQAQDDEYFADYVNDDSFNGSTPGEQAVVRDSLVAASTLDRLERLQRLNMTIQQWNLPIGWKQHKGYSLWYEILGWILTTIALSFGAPFWFDLLKRLVNVRNTGLKPQQNNK
jgi:hypothetical protein